MGQTGSLLHPRTVPASSLHPKYHFTVLCVLCKMEYGQGNCGPLNLMYGIAFQFQLQAALSKTYNKLSLLIFHWGGCKFYGWVKFCKLNAIRVPWSENGIGWICHQVGLSVWVQWQSRTCGESLLCQNSFFFFLMERKLCAFAGNSWEVSGCQFGPWKHGGWPINKQGCIHESTIPHSVYYFHFHPASLSTEVAEIQETQSPGQHMLTHHNSHAVVNWPPHAACTMVKSNATVLPSCIY